jgi:mRNA-degrading endonuclease RelE of RelBE toxin-antitoxin system
MIWLVKVHSAATKQLKAIPPDRRRRILNDIDELAEDPFRCLVRPLKAKEYKGRYGRYQAGIASIFKPNHETHTVEVLLILLRNERTYK